MLLNEQNLSKEEPMQALIFVCYSDDSGKNIPRTLLWLNCLIYEEKGAK